MTIGVARLELYMAEHNFILNFESAASWSVSYDGVPYDDARNVDGVWWYRSIVGDRNLLRFPSQDRVVPLYENPPLPVDLDPAKHPGHAETQDLT